MRPAILAHGQADAFAGDIHLGHANPDDIPDLHNLVRVLHETVGKLADMHQPVLMHADIDKSPEGRDIGDRAFQRHARAQILDIFDALREAGGHKAGTRIAAGLFKFGQDVAYRRQAEFIIHEILGAKPLQRRGITHDRADVAPASLHDLSRDAISLGMDA